MNRHLRKLLPRLTRLHDRLCQAVMWVIILLTAVMVASLCAQVFCRYVLNDSLIWPEEVSRYAFIWVSCLGMSAGVRRGDLIAIDVLWANRPKRTRLLVSIVARALIIPLLIPLSLRGVRYRPIGATGLLRRNILIYGLGGLIVPFIGIKLIDLVVHNLLGA